VVDTFLYQAGDVGECVYFISHGSVRVELTSDNTLLDSRGVAAMQVLLNKQESHGEVLVAGEHFGEFCLMSQSGLRSDSVKIMTGTELYSLSKTDLWEVFQFLPFSERRSFIYELMTRVGERHHVQRKLEDITDSVVLDHHHSDSSSAIKNLYRLAYEVMIDITDGLSNISISSMDRRLSSGEALDKNSELRRVIREQSSFNKYTQHDLIDLFSSQPSNDSMHLSFTSSSLQKRIEDMQSSDKPATLRNILMGNGKSGNMLKMLGAALAQQKQQVQEDGDSSPFVDGVAPPRIASPVGSPKIGGYGPVGGGASSPSAPSSVSQSPSMSGASPSAGSAANRKEHRQIVLTKNSNSNMMAMMTSQVFKSNLRFGAQSAPQSPASASEDGSVLSSPDVGGAGAGSSLKRSVRKAMVKFHEMNAAAAAGSAAGAAIAKNAVSSSVGELSDKIVESSNGSGCQAITAASPNIVAEMEEQEKRLLAAIPEEELLALHSNYNSANLNCGEIPHFAADSGDANNEKEEDTDSEVGSFYGVDDRTNAQFTGGAMRNATFLQPSSRFIAGRRHSSFDATSSVGTASSACPSFEVQDLAVLLQQQKFKRRSIAVTESTVSGGGGSKHGTKDGISRRRQSEVVLQKRTAAQDADVVLKAAEIAQSLEGKSGHRRRKMSLM
jgi:CRP-like cAMP-binding protein